MFIGVAIGAYSSIFIAAPVLTILKGRERRYQQLEARRAVRSGNAKAGVAAATAAAATTQHVRRRGGTCHGAPGCRVAPASEVEEAPPAKRKRR